MSAGYVLFNPLAGNGKGAGEARLLQVVLDDELEFYDITRITNYSVFLADLPRDGYLVIAGGDGTLNRFVNDTAGIDIPQEILYFPLGTGNDFARDLGKSALSEPFPITEYLKKLPRAEIKGRKYRFLSGVGYGIDSDRCQTGGGLKKVPGKMADHKSIAIRALFRYDTANATVTVDGKTQTFKKVWLASTLHGRFYGGGIMAAPEQDRLSGRLSVVIFHGAGRLRARCVFPSFFRGRHVKYQNMVTVLSGDEITVTFDRPAPLRIDGETIPDVTGYTARSANREGAVQPDRKVRGVG